MGPSGAIKYFVVIVLMTATIVSQPAGDPKYTLPKNDTDTIKV